MPERKWRQTVFSAIRFTEKETLFCSLYSFGVTGNEHIHKAKRQTPHESMLPSWCDSQERLIDRKRIDTSKTVSQIVIACQTIKEPVLTGVINVWPCHRQGWQPRNSRAPNAMDGNETAITALNAIKRSAARRLRASRALLSNAQMTKGCSKMNFSWCTRPSVGGISSIKRKLG